MIRMVCRTNGAQCIMRFTSLRDRSEICPLLYCRSPNNETLYAVLRWAHGHSITIWLIFAVNVRRDGIPCDLHDTVARSRGQTRF